MADLQDVTSLGLALVQRWGSIPTPSVIYCITFISESKIFLAHSERFLPDFLATSSIAFISSVVTRTWIKQIFLFFLGLIGRPIFLLILQGYIMADFLQYKNYFL